MNDSTDDTQFACAPDTSDLMCIETGEILAFLPYLFGAFFILGTIAIVRSELRKINGQRSPRGVSPSRDNTLLSNDYSGHGSGRQHSSNYTFTKDPQAQARALMPNRQKGTKK